MMAVTNLTRLGRLVLTSTWRHPMLTDSCRGARMSAHQLKTENKKFSAEAAEGNKILKCARARRRPWWWTGCWPRDR